MRTGPHLRFHLEYTKNVFNSVVNIARGEVFSARTDRPTLFKHCSLDCKPGVGEGGGGFKAI